MTRRVECGIFVRLALLDGELFAKKLILDFLYYLLRHLLILDAAIRRVLS